jgi:hypothetical protein
MRNKFALTISGIIGALLACTALFSHSFIISIWLLVMAVVAAVGAYLMLSSLSAPSSQPMTIALTHDGAYDEAAATLDRQWSTINGEKIRLKYSDSTADETVKAFMNMLGSIKALMEMDEFKTITSSDDRQLIYSLISTYIEKTWGLIRKNINYLNFTGAAQAKAEANLSEIKNQVTMIDETIGKIQENIVSNQSVDVSIGTEYLKQKINAEDSSLLSIV